MRMALPWNVNGVGSDAREIALEAARRQGKSLGEWLGDVIAEHAADQGLADRQLDGRERIEALTARLERMGAGAKHADPVRSIRNPRRGSADRGDAACAVDGGVHEDRPTTRHETPERIGRVADGRTGPADAFAGRDSHDGAGDDDLLEDAVRTLERRTRTERHAGAALASVAKLLDDTRARREQEYGSVADLSRKLGELEATLSRRFSADIDNPVAGSLARLEARLDAVARRGAAEAAARQSAGGHPQAGDHALRQFEAKLNTILAAVSPSVAPAPPGIPTGGVSVAALSAGRAAAGGERRGIGDAIAEISRRQRTLEGASETSVRPTAAATESQRGHGSDATLAALRAEMAGLASTVEGIRRDALFARQARPARDDEMERLRDEVAGMTRTLGDLASRGSIEALERSVATLADRIDESRERGIREHVLRPVETAVGDLRHALHAMDPRETIGGLEDELRRIADKVDGFGHGDGPGFDRLQRQMEDLREAMAEIAARPSPTQRIEDQVAALAATLDRSLARYDAERTESGVAAAALTNSAGLDAVGQRIDQLAERLDRVLSANRQTAPTNDEMPQLERLMQELALRFEAAQVRGDDPALDALQRQVEQLSVRFERSEGELAVLPDLAASLRHLFEDLEATRASVETTAARAAREVLKIAVEDGARADAASGSRQAENSAALETVHVMLGKVVDRLGTMEREIAVVRRPAPPASAPARHEPAAPPHPVRSSAQQAAANAALGGREIRLGAADPRFEGLGKVDGLASAAGERLRAVPPDDGRRGGDYIAAARRAAAAAQAEAAAAQRNVPAMRAARAGLLVRSRDYVATHKRPMLMGLAAIVMALGAMVLAGRLGDPAGPQLASRRDAAKIVVAARTPSERDASQATETGSVVSSDNPAPTPSALPKPAAAVAATIPGSDPIVTGSLPSLPAFAAGASLAPPRPTLPHALVAAAESGDPAAQYDLATRYAEGRQVPRDMKRAAGLFEKAANAGLAPAEYRLAALYEKGIGVALDKGRAKALYAKAADGGNPRAMHNLAVLLADNDGQPDYPAAIGWFRKAAQYGVHDSQYNLAVLLGKGLGAPQNLVQSYQWFAVAAAANDADAEKKREEVGLKLTANDLGVAKALAAAFRVKAPDVGAVDVAPPPGGWDGAPGSSRLNSARSKISSL